MTANSSPAEIHVAYAVGRRGGTTFRALAVVRNPGCRGFHTERLCIDDTRELATAGAVEYVRATYAREGLSVPAAVIDHGKVSTVDLDARIFVKRLDH